jgi:hypothetical protein
VTVAKDDKDKEIIYWEYTGNEPRGGSGGGNQSGGCALLFVGFLLFVFAGGILLATAFAHIHA